MYDSPGIYFEENERSRRRVNSYQQERKVLVQQQFLKYLPYLCVRGLFLQSFHSHYFH